MHASSVHQQALCAYHALLPDLREWLPRHRLVLRRLPGLCLTSLEAWVQQWPAGGAPPALRHARQLLEQAAAEAAGHPPRWHQVRAFLSEGLALCHQV